MSEFKFACPVCGQHMKCDASQSGSVMDCPTCFQKIIAPQAPEGGAQKYILTGTKLTEKKTSALNPEAAPAPEPVKKISAALVIGSILGFMAVVAAAIYWTTIIHPRRNTPVADTNAVAQVAASNAPAKPKPALVAPPADDALWTLLPGTNALPGSTVAGRIHGQDFIAERASFNNGALILRAGSKGSVEFGAFINFSGAQAESLSGQTLKVLPNAEKAARVQLRWKDDTGETFRKDFTNGYALRLEFAPLANGKLAGKLHLSLPDAEKSYLIGAFNATVVKPKPKPAPKP